MPSKRKKNSPLPADIQRQIDDVRAGLSTGLSFDTGEAGQLIEIPEGIRELTSLRSLALGNAVINIFPPWLNELPNLEVIDITYAKVTPIPSFLPNIRWSVDAEQILSFGRLLDPDKIFSISIRFDTSLAAIQRVFDLGRLGGLELSELYFEASSIYAHSPELQKADWPYLKVIDSQLDDFLQRSRKLHVLDLSGLPIGRVPEPVSRLRALSNISIIGV